MPFVATTEHELLNDFYYLYPNHFSKALIKIDEEKTNEFSLSFHLSDMTASILRTRA
jgi:hypothetical protein